MTLENRTDGAVCPSCENHPIIRDDGAYFCDCCNEEFPRAELVKLN